MSRLISVWNSAAVPKIIDGDIALHGIHALPHAHLCREVDDGVAPRECAFQCRPVTHVADDEFRIGRKVLRPLPLVNLFDERIENSDR